MMTQEMTILKTQNDSLKQEISKAELSNRLTTARTAELETQVAELKEKLTAPPSKVTAPKTGNTRDYYEQGLQTFRVKKYQEATAIFQGMLDAGAPADLEDNCHYWLGECSYAMKNFTEALEHFQHVFTFKVSEKKDDAQLMIANCYWGMGNKAKAKEEYQKFIDKYPASPYVNRAKERLGKL
jgi:TolA-binding protein